MKPILYSENMFVTEIAIAVTFDLINEKIFRDWKKYKNSFFGISGGNFKFLN